MLILYLGKKDKSCDHAQYGDLAVLVILDSKHISSITVNRKLFMITEPKCLQPSYHLSAFRFRNFSTKELIR